MILQSSWKISIVTFLHELSGKGLEPKRGSILEGIKGFYPKKKTFSSIATKFEAGVIFIWLVFCIISLQCRHARLVLECVFYEI